MKTPPEREAAKNSGERFFWTGKPCRRGHLSKRYTATGACARCAVENTLKCQASSPEHPNRIAARKAGLRHYSTGKPCPYGHDFRFVSNGICVECNNHRQRKYHAINPGKEARWARERRAKDPSSHRAASLKWAKANPEKVKQLTKRMIERDPDGWRKKCVVWVQRYNARKRNALGSFSCEDVEALRQRQKGKCAGCGKKKKLEVDHVTALAKGGTNSRSNLQLLCRTCNAGKGDKDMITWLMSKAVS